MLLAQRVSASLAARLSYTLTPDALSLAILARPCTGQNSPLLIARPRQHSAEGADRRRCVARLQTSLFIQTSLFR